MKNMFRKKHDWEEVGIVKDSGVYQKIDVDKDGKPVYGLDTNSIIIGQRWTCIIPRYKYRCKKCKMETEATPSYFKPGDRNIPIYGCKD